MNFILTSAVNCKFNTLDGFNFFFRYIYLEGSKNKILVDQQTLLLLLLLLLTVIELIWLIHIFEYLTFLFNIDQM